jgi:hypothetical protein
MDLDRCRQFFLEADSGDFSLITTWISCGLT